MTVTEPHRAAIGFAVDYNPPTTHIVLVFINALQDYAYRPPRLYGTSLSFVCSFVCSFVYLFLINFFKSTLTNKSVFTALKAGRLLVPCGNLHSLVI